LVLLFIMYGLMNFVMFVCFCGFIIGADAMIEFIKEG
jgi:hypothetical protein